ncbi:MAG: hypothetical protein CM15mP100_7770 [Alphaproteobacteria bacterium]|nr:MAG: hypothetical protein CM15mP100_7770 [Alphaproteobacteria bacterium]
MLSKLKADLSAILERDPAAGGWIRRFFVS